MMKIKVVVIAILLLPLSLVAGRRLSSSAADETTCTSSFCGLAADDGVPDDLDLLGDGGDAIIKQQIGEIVDVQFRGADLSLEEREALIERLVGKPAEEVALLIRSRRSSDDDTSGTQEDSESEEEELSPERMIAHTLAEMLKEMREGGVVQEAAYKQQVESANFDRYKWRMGFLGTLVGAIVTNVVQVGFNAWQAGIIAGQNGTDANCTV